MLHFFRKYQRYIFLLVTIVIIISFSFFGTQGTLDSNPNIWREQIAFKAVNGHDVTRLELEDMANFLATDNEDKKNYGGVWGPNFLNDGVIQKDFLETGLGLQIALAYQEDIQEELNRRLAKEQSFKLYSHPDAPFVGTEQVWSYFSPSMVNTYRDLMTSSNPLEKNAFNNRVELFLLQKQIPSSTLRYILKYQEKQYSWLKPDPQLDQMDLSLFGYHTIS
ncbi:MAG: hypothetical protein Q8K60_08815, partial [Parachlamydiaceae bacterium]|nr:hypothetical protein [Parachlamydiaceae bacterium]